MKNLKGQVLLITVMILATVMTVVLSVSFQSVTETQVSKLEEDSQKALSAAEAAIEALIREGGTGATIAVSSLSGFSDFTGQAEIESLTDTVFTSPIIAKDSSYTFYLGTYDPVAHTIGSSVARAVTVCFNNGSATPAIEITLVKADGVQKYVVDPASPKRITTDAAGSAGTCSANSDYEFSYLVPAADIGTDTKLMIVRVFYASTRLVFSRLIDFPVQGKTVTSTATTETGVSKKVVLFQSYPQIPAEFFSTTF